MLEALYKYKAEGVEDDFIVFTAGSLPFNLMSLNGGGWSAALDQPVCLKQRVMEAVRSVVGEGPHRDVWRRFRKATVREQTRTRRNEAELRRITEQFRAEGIQLLLCPFPQPLAFHSGVPYVMAVHDVQHRLQPQFPEVSANGEWEKREYVFRNGTRNATLLLADSEAGKQDILECYGDDGIGSDQVKVLPYLPSRSVSLDISEDERRRVRATHRLPERYLFYPAQFWPHKNHKRIVQALGLLKKKHGMEIKIVFCGSHTEEIRERTFHDVMTVASQLGLRKNIRYLGYIADQDISGMYAEAVGLIMPTFFGPTNIPILEAWALDCPVLTSDIRGIRDQVQDAGLLVNPNSVESLAEGIYRLWTDDDFRHTLVRRGRQRLAGYTSADYQKRLVEILEEGKLRVRSVAAIRK
jgi:glycosyltransferase involved in cell wall biosynthesis